MKAEGVWPIWQGAGWFLLLLMLVCLGVPVAVKHNRHTHRVTASPDLPLAGVRIVEISSFVAVPLAGVRWPNSAPRSSVSTRSAARPTTSVGRSPTAG